MIMIRRMVDGDPDVDVDDDQENQANTHSSNE